MSNYRGDDPAFYAIVGLVLGIILFIKGLISFYKRQFIEDIPRSTVRGIAMGLVEINGVASIVKPLKSPLTQTACVIYRYIVERYQKCGRSYMWVKITEGNSDQLPFIVEDATDKIVVYPQNAELMMSPTYTFSNMFGQSLPLNLRDFIVSNHIRDSGFGFYISEALRFKEWHIKPGEQIYVMGTAQKNEINDDVFISAGQEEKIFIISDKSEAELIKSLGWKSLIGILGGAILSTCSFIYLLYYFKWV